MDPGTIAAVGFGAVGVAVTTLVIALVATRVLGRGRRIEETIGGFRNFDAAKRVRADAYLLLVDPEVKSVYWVPMKDMGGYFTFRLRGRTGRFLPVDYTALSIDGRPVYIGVKSGDGAVELSFDVATLTAAHRLMKKGGENIWRSPSFLSALAELYEKALEEMSKSESEETASHVTALDIDYRTLFLMYTRLLTRAFYRTIEAAKSYLTVSFEKGEDIEKEARRPVAEWGKLIIYIAVAVIIGIIALFLVKVFGIG